MAYQTTLLTGPYERRRFVTPVDAPVGGRAGAWWGLVVLTAALGATVAAARAETPASVSSVLIEPAASATDASVPVVVAGAATFFAEDFHGLPMANGAPFNINDATIAASNAWPLGTRLLVRRVAGGPWDATLTPAERATYFDRSVVVTVTDRGAFSHPLDLSRAAFALLGRPAEGVIQVVVEPLQ